MLVDIAALAHPKAATLSNRQIAEHCGVDEGTVRRYRAEMTSGFPQSALRLGRDGRVINVTNGVAEHCGVDHKTVWRYRQEMQVTKEIPKSYLRLGRTDG